MRAATLLLCLGLAATSGGCMLSGGAPETATAPAPAAAPSPSVSASPPAARSAASSGGARGGAATAAARGEPVEAPPDPVIQARSDCWRKVESQKALRGIDQRIAYVDKCVADQMKGKP